MFYRYYTRENQIALTKTAMINDRYDMYTERFVDEDTLSSGVYIKEKDFFPVTSFTEINQERVEMTPTEFSITGEEKDFLKKFFLEKSKLVSKMPSLYLEQELAGDCFWKVLVKETEEKELMYEFEFEQLNAEDVRVVIDGFTKVPEKFVNEYELQVQNEDASYSTQKIKETYSMDEIEVQVITKSTRMMKENEVDIKKIPNPFKKYGVMPILWFKGYKKQDTTYSIIPSLKLIEPTLQLDYLNSDTENVTHRSAFPLTEVRHSMKKYGDIKLGAGTVFYSRGDEEVHIHDPKLDLEQLSNRMAVKTDSLYKLAGLVPPSMRAPMFNSSSSKMAKYASKEFIELTKTRLENIRIELKKALKLFLEINGKKHTDEEISSPTDILSIDREEDIKNIAMELSLGLVDDVYIWNKYYPDMTDIERDRIQEYRKEQQELLNKDNLNIDNKVVAGTIQGNKKTNSMTADQKESVTSKG